MSAEVDASAFDRELVARALWETFFHKPNQDDEAWEVMRPVYLDRADEFLARLASTDPQTAPGPD